jgi:TRAP-type C4-dicarboxylate transport system permease small subunit
MTHPRHDSLLAIFHKYLVAITMVAFIGMLLSTGGQVLFRYVLAISVPWTEELSRILFILSMFLGIAIAIREKQHIVVNFLFNKLGTRSQAIGHIVFDIAILILLCFLARGCLYMVKMTWNSYMIALDWIRTAYLYMGEFIAVIFMLLYTVVTILENIEIMRSNRKHRTPEEEL